MEKTPKQQHNGKWSRTIRACVRVTIFLAVFLFLFVTLSYMLRPIYTEGNLSRINVSGFYAERPRSLDMLYLGGSNTFTCFAPLDAWQQRGITSYMFAVNALSGDMLRYYITEAEKTQKPMLYVIDLKQFEHRSDTDLGNYDNTTCSFSYSLNRFRMIEELFPVEERLYQHIDLFRFHSRWRELNGEALSYAFNRVKNERKGFWFLSQQETGQTAADLSDVTEERALSAVSEEKLTELMETCAALKRKPTFLFVIAPHTDVSPETKAAYNTIGRIVRSYGFSFLDLSDACDEIGLDPNEDFSDQGHLNLLGAKKYTPFLLSKIEACCALPDHRGEAAYADWDALVDGWNASCEANIAQLRALDPQTAEETDDGVKIG